MKNKKYWVGGFVIASAALSITSSANAFDAFNIKKITVEGNKRITLGTMFNYLPIEIGETMDEKLSADVIRALFNTGFFKDVSLYRGGEGELIISVIERPAIAKVEFSGNKDIEKEQLSNALKDIGLADGQIFNYSLLSRVEQELRQLYFSRGKYGVRIKSEVKELDTNRVSISIKINEGSVTKIQSVNIIGNKSFKTIELQDKFKLSTPTIFSFLTSNDQYSEQKLRGDLETLRSFYLDRGYINFNIDSTQVSISPDKHNIFITINIVEGDQFVINEVKLAGDLVVDEKDIKALITSKKGEIFSRRLAVETSEKIRDLLGDNGYAFANVNVVPDIKNEQKQVDLAFVVDPGKRVYVRRINISGNLKTKDMVIRRELRQFEGAWYSTVKLNRSRTRLMLTGFFDEVNFDTPRVAGTTDQVDINLKVTERPSGNMIASIGYQPGEGAVFNISFTWDNFLGSGKKVSATLNNSNVNKIYNMSYSNPYCTQNGVSCSWNLYSRETDTRDLRIVDYISDVTGAGVSFGFPLSEYNSAKIGLSMENTRLRNIGSIPPESIGDLEGDPSPNFNTFKIEAGWSNNTRNRAIFPDEGGLWSMSAEVATPGFDKEFYKLYMRRLQYVPLHRYLALALNAELAYGDGYGDTKNLPFFEHYYAGGERSVRGYDYRTLGPKSSTSLLPLGGNTRIIGNVELQFPPPFAPKSKATRFSLFVDAGNVFNSKDTVDLDQIRYTSGLGFTWLSPIGPLTFSYAVPLNSKPGDELKSFQFTIGALF